MQKLYQMFFSIKGLIFLLVFLSIVSLSYKCFSQETTTNLDQRNVVNSNEVPLQTNNPDNSYEINFEAEQQKIQGSPRSSLDDHRVLLIGDSQAAGNFGRALGWHLTSNGVVYYARVGEVGWGVDDWLRHKFQLKRLIVKNKPTLLLFVLGGNDAAQAESVSYKQKVRHLWEISNNLVQKHKPENKIATVLWVLPPEVVGPAREQQRARDKVSRTICSVVGYQNCIESKDITGNYGRTPDGIHFTPGGGRDWASRLVPRIEEALEDR